MHEQIQEKSRAVASKSRCLEIGRVYSRRQAVPSLKKKLVSKAAIHQLDGLYCSHVINKIMPTALAAGTAALKSRNYPHCQ